MLENGGPASDSPIRALSYATEVRSGVSPLILIFQFLISYTLFASHLHI